MIQRYEELAFIHGGLDVYNTVDASAKSGGFVGAINFSSGYPNTYTGAMTISTTTAGDGLAVGDWIRMGNHVYLVDAAAGTTMGVDGPLLEFVPNGAVITEVTPSLLTTDALVWEGATGAGTVVQGSDILYIGSVNTAMRTALMAGLHMRVYDTSNRYRDYAIPPQSYLRTTSSGATETIFNDYEDGPGGAPQAGEPVQLLRLTATPEAYASGDVVVPGHQLQIPAAPRGFEIRDGILVTNGDSWTAAMRAHFFTRILEDSEAISDNDAWSLDSARGSIYAGYMDFDALADAGDFAVARAARAGLPVGLGSEQSGEGAAGCGVVLEVMAAETPIVHQSWRIGLNLIAQS